MPPAHQGGRPTRDRGHPSARTRGRDGIPHLWQGLRWPVRPQLHHHTKE
ncbi:hypothetical protein [Ornithinimicrobium cerasi]|nr:hypothetical protein [Ornithinimicrobium cerasi]